MAERRVVPVRLSPNGLATIKKMAEDCGVNRSEAMRFAMAFACTHEGGAPFRKFVREQRAALAAAKDVVVDD